MTAKHLILGKISVSDLVKLKEEMRILLDKAELSNGEKAGLIKFFELSYELAWKTLKRILLLNNSVDVKTGTKDIFREAAKWGYIEDPKLWFGFIEDQNETVHAYNETTVNNVIADLESFNQELDKLLQKLLSL